MPKIIKIALLVVAILLWINTITTYWDLKQKTKKVGVLKEEITKLKQQQEVLKKTLEYRKTATFRNEEFSRVSHFNNEFLEKLRQVRPKEITPNSPFKEWLTIFGF